MDANYWKGVDFIDIYHRGLKSGGRMKARIIRYQLIYQINTVNLDMARIKCVVSKLLMFYSNQFMAN